jgi:hypothetical protein
VRRTALLVTTLVVLAAGIAYAALGPAGNRPGPEPRRAGGPIAAIAGEVSGLYPGREARVTAHVVSRADHTLWLHSIRAWAKEASAPCPAELLTVRRRRMRERLPALGRVRVHLPVLLSEDAPDACEGATWPLRFHARVSRGARVAP